MFKRMTVAGIIIAFIIIGLVLQSTFYYYPELSSPWKNSSIKIPVLAYHSVSNSGIKNRFTVSTAEFQQQMKFLHDEGYKTISLEQFRAILQGKVKNNGKQILITFDDGYENTYTEAYPIMKQYGYIATLFVITDWMDGHNYINWDQAKLLHHSGWDIMPHTKNHKSLPLLTREDQLDEIRSAKQTIEKHLRSKVRVFAYPYGFRDKTTVDILKGNGFDYAFTFENGITDASQDPLLMKRLIVWGTKSLMSFEEELQAASKKS
ncbi:polysaccharide deacetylase family protein [Paenibacillus puldeungensis]|uniref:Polysaccharide deacetylase family protein n=1 Tax=Paenibacillus puldeungensis TaxID=696536 RepID=A0ABW3RV94_9BACL